MNNTAQQLDRVPLEPCGADRHEPPAFQFPTDEERETFEDICDFLAERAAILEYEAGFTPEAAEAEAERLALDRYPPNSAARAAILAHADRLAAHHGFPAWKALERLSEIQIRRLHVNHGYWFSLGKTFQRMRERHASR